MGNDVRVTTVPPPPPHSLPEPGSSEPLMVGPDPTQRRSLVLSMTGLGAALLVAVLSFLPAQFAIGSPGSTYDTLSEVQGVPLVEIVGAPTYLTTGELRLTTVEVARGSSAPFTLGPVIRAWLSPSQYAVPEEEVFGTPDQREEFDEQSQQAWISSQEAATVAALSALGQPVPATLEVAQVDEASHATGALQMGDILTGVNGIEATVFADLAAALADVAPGDDVDVEFVRDGENLTASFATLDDGAGGALMGLWIDPHFEMPIDVSVQIDSVGGPSAGLMFSLAIMDLLTEGDELDGARIAGTGTITADGDVGSIGGIVMKMHGAVADGAEYFLAPALNCSQVVGNVPDGLSVFSVETLDDAYEIATRIGAGDIADLPTCRAE